MHFPKYLWVLEPGKAENKGREGGLGALRLLSSRDLLGWDLGALHIPDSSSVQWDFQTARRFFHFPESKGQENP